MFFLPKVVWTLSRAKNVLHGYWTISWAWPSLLRTSPPEVTFWTEMHSGGLVCLWSCWAAVNFICENKFYYNGRNVTISETWEFLTLVHLCPFANNFAVLLAHFSKSRLLATFNCKMVAIKKFSRQKKHLKGRTLHDILHKGLMHQTAHF